MKCPECASQIKGNKCACGWTAGKANEKSAGIGDCAWIANGEQCHYPGTISHNSHGMGPWYCRFHASTDISQTYGEQVVRESRNYRHLTQKESDAIHLARIKDPSYQPAFKGCEELRCLKKGPLRTNGRYLCDEHKHGECEYTKHGPKKGRAANRISVREPGEDMEEAA